MIYYVSLGASVDEMKRVYREQDEKKYSARALQHLDEKLTPVRVVFEKNTSLRTLMLTAEDRSRIVVNGFDAINIDLAKFVALFEKRQKDGITVRLLKENFLLAPDDQPTNSILAGILSTHAKKLNSRVRSLPSIAEVHGEGFVEAMRQERRNGALLREIADKFQLSVTGAYRYTKGIRPECVKKAAPDKAKPAPSGVSKLLASVASTPEERLEQLIELFLAGQRKPSTAKVYRIHLACYRAFCREVLSSPADSLAMFTLERVVAFKQHRLELGKQPATVAAELMALRAFLKFCFEEDEIAKNPLQRLKVPKIERKVLTDALTRTDTDKVIAAAEEMLKEALTPLTRWKAHRDLLAIYLLSGVGMRHSGLLSLRKQDVIDAPRGVSLSIASKSNAGRYTIRVSKFVADAVETYIDRYLYNDPPEAYLFHPSPDAKDRPMSLSASNLRITAVFDRAGVTPRAAGRRYRRAHSLRVSWARLAYEGGTDIRKIQHKMNHKSVDQTYAYLKIDDEEVDTYWLKPIRLPTNRDADLRL
jgi:site-specific recombinase XerD